MAGRKNHQFYFHDLPQQEKRKGMICKKRGATTSRSGKNNVYVRTRQPAITLYYNTNTTTAASLSVRRAVMGLPQAETTPVTDSSAIG